MITRTFHQTIWLAQQMCALRGELAVICKDVEEKSWLRRFMWRIPGRNPSYDILESGGNGIHGPSPDAVILDESFIYWFSNAIWFDACIAPRLKPGVKIYALRV